MLSRNQASIQIAMRANKNGVSIRHKLARVDCTARRSQAWKEKTRLNESRPHEDTRCGAWTQSVKSIAKVSKIGVRNLNWRCIIQPAVVCGRKGKVAGDSKTNYGRVEKKGVENGKKQQIMQNTKLIIGLLNAGKNEHANPKREERKKKIFSRAYISSSNIRTEV